MINKKQINIPEKSNLQGLNQKEKMTMFFFGFVIVLLHGGNRYFYHLSGNDKQKRQKITYYILGIIFWIITFVLISYLVDAFET